MRSRCLLVAVGLVGLVGLLAPAVRADQLSRGEEQLHQELGQLCRYPTDASNDCDSLDGYHLAEADVQRYEASWVHRALGLQRALDDDVALKDELLPHTHNSFNSEAYTPTLSRMDHNQLLSLTDQLRLDIRAVEIDVHRSVSVTEGKVGVVACHANENEVGPAHLHVGCTSEEPLRPYLEELQRWLEDERNSSEFVLLYLENHLEGDPAAHDAAVADIRDTIGPLVYRNQDSTPDAPCASMPYDASRASLRPARVLIVGDCGPGEWGSYVHLRGDRWDESSNPAGDDYACATERTAHDYDAQITRRYEDRTWLSAMVGGEGGITEAEMASMVACGVNLVGFDMLHPDDPRLATLVWSWAPEEPRAPGCAVQGTDGRFVSAPCSQKRRAACFDGQGWTVTRRPVRFDRAAASCESVGAHFDVPWNGWENGRLLEVSAGDVWVAYAGDPSGWQPDRGAQ